ncbi:MAG: penicillin-binding protein 2, partial [Candidatus Aureabacteria bacterium]|nr:penicillin-binding protein 2 [Candidatus Auribacterota bacterium]
MKNAATINLRKFKNRLKLLYILVFLTFFILGKQLWFLQIEQGAYFQDLALKNRIRSVVIAPPRGRIFDANGSILVDNRPRFDLVST